MRARARETQRSLGGECAVAAKPEDIGRPDHRDAAKAAPVDGTRNPPPPANLRATARRDCVEKCGGAFSADAIAERSAP